MKANRTLPLAFVVVTSLLAALSIPAPAMAAGPPDHLLYAQQPTDVVAGADISPAVTVQVLDIDGNLVTDPVDVTVALSGGDSSATLGGTKTQTSVSGVATFDDLTVNKVGTGYQLTASATGVPDLPSDPFAVSAGPADHLLFDQQPTDIHAGAAITPAVTVQVFDALDNLVSDPFDVTVTLTGGSSGAHLGGHTTRTSVAGVSTFDDLTVDKVGTGYQVQAGGTGVTGDTSASFDVIPGSATHVAFVQQPSDAVAGDDITPAVTVEVLDGNDNRVTDEPVDVTVELSGGDPDATLGGTKTHSSVNGLATFDDLTVNKAAAGYSLVASATGLTGDTSTTFKVSPSTATQLVFTQQPVHTPAGVVMPKIIVAVEDQFGNVVTDPPPGKVVMTIARNPSGGHLSGKTSRFVVAGEATFATLVIDKPGTNYTLSASGLGLPPVISDTFNIKGYTRVAMTAPRHLIGYGQGVRLTAHLAACLDGCVLTIYRLPVGDVQSIVGKPDRKVDSHGNVVLTVTPGVNTTFWAVFSGDSRYRKAESNHVKITVHVVVQNSLAGRSFGSKDGYRLYHYYKACAQHGISCPLIRGKVIPNKAGKQMQFVLQAHVNGRWQTVSPGHNKIGSDGTATLAWVYSGPGVKGVPLRTRASFAGDAYNSSAAGPWRYFKVV